MNKVKFLIVAMLVLMILTSCMAGSGRNTPEYRAGFFSGVWHGWIAPIALIWSLFDDEVKIYEVNNIGFWYELGFYMAIISGFGGLQIVRKKKS